MSAVLVTPPNVPLIVTSVSTHGTLVFSVNSALDAPGATVTLAGGMPNMGSEVLSGTVAPLPEAARFNTTQPSVGVPPATSAGLITSPAGSVGAAHGAALAKLAQARTA